jgi:hypothetical protein
MHGWSAQCLFGRWERQGVSTSDQTPTSARPPQRRESSQVLRGYGAHGASAVRTVVAQLQGHLEHAQDENRRMLEILASPMPVRPARRSLSPRGKGGGAAPTTVVKG